MAAERIFGPGGGGRAELNANYGTGPGGNFFLTRMSQLRRSAKHRLEWKWGLSPILARDCVGTAQEMWSLRLALRIELEALARGEKSQ